MVKQQNTTTSVSITKESPDSSGSKKVAVMSKQDMLMGSLKQFFSSTENLGKMIPILTQKSKISLRLLDWFVTNYAKKKNIGYFIDVTKGGKKRNVYFNVFLNYKSQLKAYSKQQFDPFCRKWKLVKKKKIYCGIHFYHKKDHYVETTVGQLNFFRWIIANKVLDYAIEHLTDIQRDMLVSATNKKRKATKTESKKKSQQKVSKSTAQKALTAPNKTETKNNTASVNQILQNSIKANSSKPSLPQVSVNATKKLTKQHISITVDFN